MENTFLEIGLVIIASAVLGLLAKLLKQPLILAYIVAGVLIGPIFGFVTNQESITLLAHFGIALLLFLIGLELDINKLKNLGFVTTIISLGQIAFSFIIFFFIAKSLGFNLAQSILWAIGLTLSSTVIVIKLISEKHNLHSLYGRILIGILLFQDLIAILSIVGLKSFTNQDIAVFDIVINLILTIAKGLGFLILAWLFAKYILPKAFATISQNYELLFLSAISWFFALSIVSYMLGFSVEIGAFVAGITLAPLPFSLAITSRVKPLRDFFITIFFVTLGTQIIFTEITLHRILLIIILTLAVFVIKPLIVFLLMGLVGYKSRTSFMVGTSLAQVSEFSFIIFALAKNYDLLSATDLTMITTVGILSIAGSTYFITHMEQIFRSLRSFLKFFELRKIKRDDIEHIPEELQNHVVIFGCRRTGKRIMGTLRHYGKKILVVDHDPEIIQDLKKQNIPCIFGDMADLDLLEKIGLENASMVISTVDNESDNSLILKVALKKGHKPLIYVVANEFETAIELYKKGSHYVVIPRMLSGEFLAKQLREVSGDIEKLYQHTEGHRKKNLEELKEIATKEA